MSSSGRVSAGMPAPAASPPPLSCPLSVGSWEALCLPWGSPHLPHGVPEVCSSVLLSGGNASHSFLPPPPLPVQTARSEKARTACSLLHPRTKHRELSEHLPSEHPILHPPKPAATSPCPCTLHGPHVAGPVGATDCTAFHPPGSPQVLAIPGQEEMRLRLSQTAGSTRPSPVPRL